MGRHFTEILAAEWQGVLSRSWNSKRPLVFDHVILTKTFDVRRVREIRARITRHMDLWERGQHVGLVGDAEGAAQEGKADFSKGRRSTPWTKSSPRALSREIPGPRR